MKRQNMSTDEYALTLDMANAMEISIGDNPYGLGEWCLKENGVAKITTRFSRDSSQSRNGGDYDEWREYSIMPDGVLAEDKWSCDFSELEYTNSFFYKIDISSLQPIMENAEDMVKRFV